MHQRSTETLAKSPIVLRHQAHTDVGHKRAVNEDSLLAEHPVYIVADGMGGHEAGDLASAAVVEAFRPLVGSAEVLPADVVAAVGRAQTAVEGISAGRARGAGSTLSGIVLVNEQTQPAWLVLNVGDSRVYRLSGGELSRITHDHSLVQEMLDSGTLAPEDAADYVGRNVITRAIGAADARADYWMHPVITGERLLVCSDGLSGELPDEVLRVLLAMGGPVDSTASELLTQALLHGGRDNVSLIVIDVLNGGAADLGDGAGPDSGVGEHDTVDLLLEDTAKLPWRKGRGGGR
ncbi:PP2C family protein-serine/threonine phosphatase [Microterricola pindariensis]|uniref:PP2C family protein-serine/threonine phosphatase n=1 Tax=Microterricola pindariensis TaxID=478010 RepID=UPI000CEC4532|nr:protein phosphatase 2C domain-containing protein [Microterricola pindariensis]